MTWAFALDYKIATSVGIYQTHNTKITEFESPVYFADEMVEGAFKSFKHEHHFNSTENGTMMIDRFEYKSPYGIIGNLVDDLFLRNYMTKLLIRRNQIIKEFAESERWKEVLSKTQL